MKIWKKTLTVEAWNSLQIGLLNDALVSAQQKQDMDCNRIGVAWRCEACSYNSMVRMIKFGLLEGKWSSAHSGIKWRETHATLGCTYIMRREKNGLHFSSVWLR